MRLALLLVLTVLTACAVREQVDFVDGPAPGTLLRPVLVATSRGPDPNQPVPGWTRAFEVSFGRYTVSIPPDREIGQISRPRDHQPADPEKHFMLAQAQPLSAAEFRDGFRASLAQLPPNEREAVIFVHGFNTTFIEGVYRTAQLANDLHIPGVVAHYSWPSLGAPLAYAHDRDSALFARDGLIDMLHEVRAAGPRRIIIIAHSMGAQLFMEALRQMALTHDPALAAIGGIFLISPDVDVQLFRQQVSDIGQLPEPFMIITSQRDRVLTLSARLTGQTSRLGNMPDASQVEGLDVTLLDVSAFGRGVGHFTVGSSPALIGLLDQMEAVNTSLLDERAGALPLLPATILTLQNTTQVILQPLTETRPRRILPWWLQRGQSADTE